MSLDAEDIRNEKVKVLQSMQTVRLEDVVLGQYRARTAKGVTLPGYLDDPTVPPGRCVGGVWHMPSGRLPSCCYCGYCYCSTEQAPVDARTLLDGVCLLMAPTLFKPPPRPRYTAALLPQHHAHFCRLHRVHRQPPLGRRALPAQGRQGAVVAHGGDSSAGAAGCLVGWAT